MEEKVFQACYEKWMVSNGGISIWPELAQEFGYQDGEILRGAFKRARKKKGITKQGILKNENIKNNPKILIFDIETSYIEIASWGINKQYINKNQILNDWFIISYAAKWLYDENIYSSVLTSKEAIKKDDKRILKELWELLNKCDIAITYNGNNFDIPKVNTRFIINEIYPPSNYKSIDVFQTISRNFAFTSRAMDYVNLTLDLERKKETGGLDLWKRCIAGDGHSLNDMLDYNEQDVIALQETYLAVRPWIKNHPNIGLWHDSKESVCGYCGSTDFEYISNLYSTPAGLFKSFRCNNCHAIGRTQEQCLSKEKRKGLMKITA